MAADEIQYKAVRGAIQRAGRAGSQAARKGKKTTRVARSAADRPEYDGDNDGFITNPLTGKDEIPWNKAEETAEEAIAKFFSQRGRMAPQKRETVREIVEQTPAKKPAGKPEGKPDRIEMSRGDIERLMKEPLPQKWVDAMKPMVGTKPKTPPDPWDPRRWAGLLNPPRIAGPRRGGAGGGMPRDVEGGRNRPIPMPGFEYIEEQASAALAISRRYRIPDRSEIDLRRLLKDLDEADLRDTSGPDSESRRYRNQVRSVIYEEMRKRYDENPFDNSPPPRAALEQHMGAVNMFSVAGRMTELRWPKDSSGKLVGVSQLPEEDLGHNLRVVQYMLADIEKERIDGGTKEVVERLQQLQQDMLKAFPNSKERGSGLPDLRDRLQPFDGSGNDRAPWAKPAIDLSEYDFSSLIGRWLPSPRWKSRRTSQYSWLGDNARVEEALDSEYITVEVVDARSHGFDRDGYILVGEFYDVDSQSWQTWDEPDMVHNSIDDAMKFAEDLEMAIETQDLSPYDPDFQMPNPNSITDKPIVSQTPWRNAPNKPARSKTKGRLGENRRTHSYISPFLDDARRLFEDKWFDRRRNATLIDNIEFAKDRLRELELLWDRMGADFENQFPGMEEAWNMSVEEFARWALSRGLVDSLIEGRNYHAELMDVWDQAAADQNEIGEMMAEIRETLDKFTEKLNEKIDNESPSFSDMTRDDVTWILR